MQNVVYLKIKSSTNKLVKHVINFRLTLNVCYQPSSATLPLLMHTNEYTYTRHFVYVAQ